jgi:predicted dehydrogenase
VLKAGRHLLLEKPIAVSVGACQRLLAAHAQHCPDKVFMVAENAQYWPEIVHAQALIQDGAIGEVLTARAKAWESAMGACVCRSVTVGPVTPAWHVSQG